MAPDFVPFNLELWTILFHHRRDGSNALTWVGNILGALGVPPKVRRGLVNIHNQAIDRYKDLGGMIEHDLGQLGDRRPDRLPGPDLCDPAPAIVTRLRMRMTRHRWLDLADELLAGLHHAQAARRLVAASVPLMRPADYDRVSQLLDSLRDALHDVLVAREPTWAHASVVFHRHRDDRRIRMSLGDSDPDDSVEAFFRPVTELSARRAGAASSKCVGLNLADEVRRRNDCRYGLVGLAVRVDDVRATTIRSTRWDEYENLVITLADGDQVDPSRCRLIEEWPVSCCPPGPPVGAGKSRRLA